jgi:hypothetical protein
MLKAAAVVAVLCFSLVACGEEAALDSVGDAAAGEPPVPASGPTCDDYSVLTYEYDYDAQGAPSAEGAVAAFLQSTFAKAPPLPAVFSATDLSEAGYQRSGHQVVYRSDEGSIVAEFAVSEGSKGWLVGSALLCKTAISAGFEQRVMSE